MTELLLHLLNVDYCCVYTALETTFYGTRSWKPWCAAIGAYGNYQYNPVRIYEQHWTTNLSYVCQYHSK